MIMDDKICYQPIASSKNDQNTYLPLNLEIFNFLSGIVTFIYQYLLAGAQHLF